MSEKRNRTPVLYVDDAGGHHKTALEAQAENRRLAAIVKIRNSIGAEFLTRLRLRMEKETGDEALLGDLAEMLWECGLIVHIPRGPATPKQMTLDEVLPETPKPE